MICPWRCLLVPGLLLVGACTDSDPATTPMAWFEDEAGLRGLEFSHVSGADGGYLLPEIIGGGVALVDVDGDDDLDVYLVQSGRLGASPDAGTAPGNQLYLNRGDGSFTEAVDSGANDTGYGMGITTGDYDSDGDTDLYITNVGPNVLLQNDGQGHFLNVTSSAGVGDPGFSTAATFFDADADGDLDLFVANYVAWSRGIERDCHDYGTGIRNYCDPGNYSAPALDRLYNNNGDGTFTDISTSAGLGSARGNGLGVVSADFNADGLADIFVANDQTMNHLWLNRGGLVFADEAVLWGCAMDDHGIAKAGMGVAAADIDDDGDVDLLVVNIEGETDSMFRNEGSYFVDATASLGLGTISRRYTRFGVALADFDNDGLLDLYEANGRVTYSPEPEDDDVFAEPNVLFRGVDGGRFESVLPEGGVLKRMVHTSRGAAIGDIDADGRLDIVVVNRDGPAYLLMNRTGAGANWIRFRALTADGLDALGATVSGLMGTARKTRAVQTAGSYLAAHDPTAHFGLGTHAELTDITVRWPTGESEAFGNFPAGDTVELRQGRGLRVD